MRFRWRKNVKLGPVRVHLVNGKPRGWSLKLGRLHWHSRHRRLWFDTPGPGGVEIDSRSHRSWRGRRHHRHGHHGHRAHRHW